MRKNGTTSTEYSDPYYNRIIIKMKRTHKQLGAVVLEQDQHLENLEKIITRDFYPELGQLQHAPSDQVPAIGLNNYLANFKSDENQNFSKMVHDDEKSWKDKHWWIQYSKKSEEEKQKMLMSSESGNNYKYMLDYKKNNLLQILPAQETNNFFFNAKQNIIDEVMQQYNKQKKIIYANTRLEQCVKPLEYAIEKKNQDYVLDSKLLSTPMLQGIQDEELKKQEKYKLDQDDFKKPLDKKRIDMTVGGYKIMTMPSPSPNAMQSPLMTYGQIEGTPERLPQYYVPQTPKKDLILDRLNQSIVNKKKQELRRKQTSRMRLLESMTPSSIKNFRKDSSTYRKMTQSITHKSKSEENGLGGALQGLLKL